MNISTLKQYYRLTKPGIVYGNALHVIVGFLLAFRYGLSWMTFFGVFIGVALVIASACVANNYLDRNIDSYMKRTKTRELVLGAIRARNAIIYAFVLGTLGIGILLLTTNILTSVLGVIAYGWYVWIYGYAKRKTYYSTIIGSVPGALPLVAGYTAVSNSFDIVAVVLFVMLCLWQIPHFYAISVARKIEYASAKIPVITAYKSNDTIRKHMISWTTLYIGSIVLLAAVGGIHLGATVLWLLVVVYWMWHMVREYPNPTPESWAMRSFRLSLLMPVALIIVAAGTVVLA